MTVPRVRVSRDERERQILDAAVSVFSARGYAGASMDAVAERVGVTKPVLYTHFGSKEGLLLACLARARTELLEATARAAASASTPEEMLRRGTRAFFGYLDDRAPAWTLLYAQTGAAGAEAIEQVRAQQTDFIAGLLAAQDPGADRARLLGWAQVIVGACERLAVWRGRLDPADPDHVDADRATEYLMDMVWSGLAGR